MTQGAMTNVSLKRGTVEHAAEVSSVMVAPSIISWQGATPNSQRSVAGVWTFSCNAVQDFADPESFVSFLLDNEGAEVAITWKPDADEAFQLTTTFRAAPPTIGGAVNQFNESSLSFPCSKPVITRPAPTP